MQFFGIPHGDKVEERRRGWNKNMGKTDVGPQEEEGRNKRVGGGGGGRNPFPPLSLSLSLSLSFSLSSPRLCKYAHGRPSVVWFLIAVGGGEKKETKKKHHTLGFSQKKNVSVYMFYCDTCTTKIVVRLVCFFSPSPPLFFTTSPPPHNKKNDNLGYTSALEPSKHGEMREGAEEKKKEAFLSFLAACTDLPRMIMRSLV